MAVILIAEDEKRCRASLLIFKTGRSIPCIPADDGIDAVTILKHHPVDLVILDIMMPHIDGFAVCRLAREMYDIPIMFLTAKSDEDDKLKGYEYGADDYYDETFQSQNSSGKSECIAAPF